MPTASKRHSVGNLVYRAAGSYAEYYPAPKMSLTRQLLKFKFMVVVNSLCKSAAIDYSVGLDKFS